MCGCCSRAAISAEEAFVAERRRQFGMQHFHGHRPVVLEVFRQVDSCHPAAAELTLDAIGTRQRGGDSSERRWHFSHGTIARH